MGKRFIISEEQLMSLKEQDNTLTVTAKPDKTGNKADAVQKAEEQILAAGGNPNKVNIEIPATEKNESRVISKKELIENRLRKLKEHSKVYSVGEFIKKMQK